MRRWRMPDLARHAPPGLELEGEKKLFGWGLLCAAGYSLLFLVRYLDARDELFYDRLGKKVLWENAVMPDFAQLLGDALYGFAVLAVCLAGVAVWHYLYHWQGSKSIYTLRRLPDRWVLHRRCLTLPLAGLAVCAAAALALLLVYYAVYQLATPAACLTPGQWQKLWR